MVRMKPKAIREDGQGLVEYSLIIMFVALLAVVGLTALGLAIPDVYQTVADVFP